MTFTKPALEKLAAVATALAAAVQSVLVAQGVEGPDLAASITSALAVLLGGYHGTAAIVTAKTEPSLDVNK